MSDSEACGFADEPEKVRRNANGPLRATLGITLR